MQNKEIEGYIVPYDMPECEYIKGDIVPITRKFKCNGDWYSLKKLGSLPASIVEKWEVKSKVKWRETYKEYKTDDNLNCRINKNGIALYLST